MYITSISIYPSEYGFIEYLVSEGDKVEVGDIVEAPSNIGMVFSKGFFSDSQAAPVKH